MDLIIRKCNNLFGQLARLGNDTPAHQALLHQIDVSVGRLPDNTLKRPPSHLRSKWLDQIRSENNLPSADLCTCAIHRDYWRNSPSWLLVGLHDDDDPTTPVFYRPDALPAAQPTASKHWRPKTTTMWFIKNVAVHLCATVHSFCSKLQDYTIIAQAPPGFSMN